VKIAIVGTRGLPARYSGIESYVEEIAPRLVAHGHSVTVYCRPQYFDGNPIYKGVDIAARPCIKTKHLETISHSLLCTLDSLLKGYDIVHFHALGSSVFSFLPRIKGVKTAVTIHGLDWQREKWGNFAKWYLKKCELSSLHFPTETIVVSRTLQKYYKENYRKHVTYLPNGVNMQEPRSPELIKERGLAGDDYILFVGRLTPEKGCHHLIEAYKKLNTKLKLVVVGGSSYTDEYVEALSKQANEDIMFLGYVFGDELRELYSNARLFVLPSEIEGLSISLLEAMSYGKCVVASDIPENLEVIEDCGFRFQSANTSDLARLLQELIENPDLVEEIGERARQRVLKEYNWDVIASQTEQLYLSLIGQ
jgi:glycosyltransferase involved in cell wall biosynthesis